MSPNPNDMTTEDDIFELTDVVDGGGESGPGKDDVDVSFEQELEDLFSDDDDDLFSGSSGSDVATTMEYDPSSDSGDGFGGLGDDLGLDDDEDGGGIDFEATMAMDDIDFSDLGGGLGDDDMDFDTAMKAVEDKGDQEPETPEADDDFSLELDDDDGVMDLGGFEDDQEDDEPMDLGDMSMDDMDIGGEGDETMALDDMPDMSMDDMDLGGDADETMALGEDDGLMDLGDMDLGGDDLDDDALEIGELSLDDDDDDDIADLGEELSLDDDDLGDASFGLTDDEETMSLDDDFDDVSADETTVETGTGLDDLVGDLEIAGDLGSTDTMSDKGKTADDDLEMADAEMTDLEDLGDLGDLDDDLADMSLDDDLGLGGGEIELTETLATGDDIPLSREEEDLLSVDSDEDTLDDMSLAEQPEEDSAISLEDSMIVDEEDEDGDEPFDLDGSIPLDETLSMGTPPAPEAPREEEEIGGLPDLDDMDGDIDLGGLDDADEELDLGGADDADELDDTLIDDDGIMPEGPDASMMDEEEEPDLVASEPSAPAVDMSAFTDRLKGLESLARERLEAIEERINENSQVLEQARAELDSVKAEMETVRSAQEEREVPDLSGVEARIAELEAQVESLKESNDQDLSAAIEEVRLTANAASMAAHEAGVSLESAWSDDAPQVSAFKAKIIEEVQGLIAGEVTALEGKVSETPDFSKVPDMVWQKVEEAVLSKLEELVADAVREQVDAVAEEFRETMRATVEEGMGGQLELSASAAAARVVREELANLAREMDM